MEEHSTRIAPIPSPEEFAKYKQVQEDMPDRILKQFEQDSVATRELTDKALSADSVLVIILFGAFFLAYIGKDIAAILTGLSAFVLIFKDVFSRKNR